MGHANARLTFHGRCELVRRVRAGQEFPPTSACRRRDRGQVRPGQDRLGGLAWNVHRCQPLAGRAE